MAHWKIAFPFRFWFKRTARPKDAHMEKNTVNTLKYAVFQIEPRNTLSLKMAAKLSSPMNFMGLKPSHSAMLKAREKKTGIRTKIKNPTKLGMIKERPTRVFLLFSEICFLLIFGVCKTVTSFILKEFMDYRRRQVVCRLLRKCKDDLPVRHPYVLFTLNFFAAFCHFSKTVINRKFADHDKGVLFT